MQRKQITQLFPCLTPLRKKQRECCFYLGMNFDGNQYAKEIATRGLPHTVFESNSLLYNHDTGFAMVYQENKVFNLKLAAKKLDGLLIKPKETFSFWKAIKSADRNTPYKLGLTVVNGELTTVAGGGMCQISNLLFWTFLHSPLTIVERHSHRLKDFPAPSDDIPMGVDATVSEGWLDLKVRNDTENVYQIQIRFDKDKIYCQFRSDHPTEKRYAIVDRELLYFSKNDKTYEQVSIWQQQLEEKTGELLCEKHLYNNVCEIGYALSPETMIDRR